MRGKRAAAPAARIIDRRVRLVNALSLLCCYCYRERYHLCRMSGWCTAAPLMFQRGDVQLLEPDQFVSRNARLFAVTRAALAKLLPGARVEHIGASAIEGAWSKGDLDVCVVVSAAQHASAIKLLQANGWHVKKDTLRTDQLCMLVSDEIADLALQLVAADSQFLFFITFRDRLNADPRLVERYNEIKLQHVDAPAEHYRAAKSAFIEQVLAQAGDHAGQQK
jgi:GrpB-like predicted nucleotidyltransferase (UPF0157 family)